MTGWVDLLMMSLAFVVAVTLSSKVFEWLLQDIRRP